MRSQDAGSGANLEHVKLASIFGKQALKTINTFPAVVLTLLIWAGMVRARASELWAPAVINSEVADDFEVIGNIDRVFAP